MFTACTTFPSPIAYIGFPATPLKSTPVWWPVDQYFPEAPYVVPIYPPFTGLINPYELVFPVFADPLLFPDEFELLLLFLLFDVLFLGGTYSEYFFILAAISLSSSCNCSISFCISFSSLDNSATFLSFSSFADANSTVFACLLDFAVCKSLLLFSKSVLAFSISFFWFSIYSNISVSYVAISDTKYHFEIKSVKSSDDSNTSK